ncbi:KOW domain-containing protein family protein [Dirofilaria immitis]|nr:KOW domain-containing protein family protein [Dirofilaria immitis]
MWPTRVLLNSVRRTYMELDYAKHMPKEYVKKHEEKVAIPAEEWTIFPGDLVVVMVGKDKSKTGVVSHVNKETNAVFVRGRHTKLINEHENFAGSGMDSLYRQVEQPLYVHKGQVKLVDPSDKISKRSKFEIPVPQLAQATSEYLSPDRYVEVEGKDTPADVVLEKTYKPVLKSFEEEIADEMGIQDKRKLQPTYWY